MPAILKDKIKLIERKKIEDHRGWFLKVINGKEEGLPDYTGEVYITVANPGEMKGGHYHPEANEWFTLISGNCLVQLYDTETNEELTIELNANEPFTLFVPNKIAHAFVNTDKQEQFMLMAYSDQLYKPMDTITFSFLNVE